MLAASIHPRRTRQDVIPYAPFGAGRPRIAPPSSRRSPRARAQRRRKLIARAALLKDPGWPFRHQLSQFGEVRMGSITALRVFTLALGAAWTISGIAWAQDDGKVLFETCKGCHA